MKQLFSQPGHLLGGALSAQEKVGLAARSGEAQVKGRKAQDGLYGINPIGEGGSYRNAKLDDPLRLLQH